MLEFFELSLLIMYVHHINFNWAQTKFHLESDNQYNCLSDYLLHFKKA